MEIYQQFGGLMGFSTNLLLLNMRTTNYLEFYLVAQLGFTKLLWFIYISISLSIYV
jgi:hypothetical protein